MSENETVRHRPDRPQPQGQPPYTPPRVILYSEEALMERLGPAKACASFPLFGAGNEPQQPPAGEKKLDFKL
ncbi:MAG: hypothetical protein QHJ73_12680 [Armatimonadota bacterium]|nr:hypothetical protein [Armatimonadota bacterium]